MWRRVRLLDRVLRVAQYAPLLLICVGGCSPAANGQSSGSPTGAPPNGGTAAGPACGRPPLAPCPMQQWMKANVAPAFNNGQLERLVAPLGTLASAAPPEFPDWEGIARRGAAAAARGDQNGVRTACGDCHKAYREPYRAQMRARQFVTAINGRTHDHIRNQK